MPETMNWTISVQVPAGPRLARSGALQVDAYDKLDLTVPDEAEDLEVEIQPGGTGQVQVLVIMTGMPGDSLSYKVNDAGADPVVLDQPVHAYLGAGPVALLDAAAGPNTLLFTNASGAAADVQILVGRRATA